VLTTLATISLLAALAGCADEPTRLVAPRARPAASMAPGPVLVVSTDTLAFPATDLTLRSDPKEITYTNVGATTLHFGPFQFPGGANPSDFRMQGTNNGQCDSVLAPGARCVWALQFEPQALGARSGTFTVSSDGGTAVVALTGVGTSASVRAEIAPTALAFGTVAIDASSTTQHVTIKSSGLLPMTISSIKLVGADAVDFITYDPVDPYACKPGVAMSTGASCEVLAYFHPRSAGQKSASVSIVTDGGSATVPLSGFGDGPGVKLTPDPLTFAAQVVGTTGTQELRLTNYGTKDLVLSYGFGLSGANAADYWVTWGGSSPCQPNMTLAPSASCTLVVTFTPSGTGTRTAKLTIASNAPYAYLAMSGEGYESADVGVAMTAAQTTKGIAYDVMVTNKGPNAAASVSVADLIPTGTTFVGATSSTNVSCYLPAIGGTGRVACSIASLAPGQTGTLSITVRPNPGVKGSITNTVLANSPTPDPVSANNTVTVTTTLKK
jgi:uncharacterized repeat protein (TIGR01451 family)